MQEHDVPEWYIESLAKIGYLFPKAHAVAYVMMAFRIAWFKVHEPLAFYATFFTVRAKAFDAEYCCAGLDAVKRKIREIENNKDASAVEQDLMTTLEVCYEFYRRGFHFDTIDIYRSDATKFTVTEGGLLPPFISQSTDSRRRPAARWTVKRRARSSSRSRSSPCAAISSPRRTSSSCAPSARLPAWRTPASSRCSDK